MSIVLSLSCKTTRVQQQEVKTIQKRATVTFSQAGMQHTMKKAESEEWQLLEGSTEPDSPPGSPPEEEIDLVVPSGSTTSGSNSPVAKADPLQSESPGRLMSLLHHFQSSTSTPTKEPKTDATPEQAQPSPLSVEAPTQSVSMEQQNCVQAYEASHAANNLSRKNGFIICSFIAFVGLRTIVQATVKPARATYRGGGSRQQPCSYEASIMKHIWDDDQYNVEVEALSNDGCF